MKARGDVPLPRRATKGSAGYDFFMPSGCTLSYNQAVTINTGISMEPGDIPQGYVGLIVPRSSWGMKYGITLCNTVGVIDSDYTDEIVAKIRCTDPSVQTVRFNKGERFCQMVLVPYGIIASEIEPTATREGGVGSTGQ